MKKFSRWLGAKPHRGTVLNILMLVLLLAMIGSPLLFAVVGASAIAAGALLGLRRAWQALARRRVGTLLFDRVLVWMPGAVALGLGTLGLYLAVTSPEGTVGYRLGVVLFAFELAMLAIPAIDTYGASRRAAGART